MHVIVTYDVVTGTAEGRKRLRNVAKVCKNFGQRVQKSVFECSVSEAKFEEMRRELIRNIDEKADSLRIYRLHEPKDQFVQVFGVDAYVDFNGPLIV